MGERKQAEKENKGDKETNKETKSYHSEDTLFPDSRAVSYLRVNICGVSKLTGMPMVFFLVYLSGLNMTTLGMKHCVKQRKNDDNLSQIHANRQLLRTHFIHMIS